MQTKMCAVCKRAFRKMESRVWRAIGPVCFNCRAVADQPTTAVPAAAVTTTAVVATAPAATILPPPPSPTSTPSAEPASPKPRKARAKKPKPVPPQLLPRESEENIVETLQHCGERLLLASITYQKPTAVEATERKIEPYSFRISEAGDVAVFSRQVEPKPDGPSWRTFRLDRILSVRATVIPFYPEASVTIHTGEVRNHPKGDPWADVLPEMMYLVNLRAALADFQLTETEQADLLRIAANIPKEKIRAVNGRVYGDLLNEICQDGVVTDEEIERLTTVRVWLNELGWSP